jgi:hypothetical protein
MSICGEDDKTAFGMLESLLKYSDFRDLQKRIIIIEMTSKENGEQNVRITLEKSK